VGLFSKRKKDKATEATDARIDQNRAPSNSLVKSGHSHKDDIPQEITLFGIPYISLPPSPLTWQLRREQNQDFYSIYDDPQKRPVIEAYRKGQYNKVVGFIDRIPLAERDGAIGQTFLKAYRNLIQNWRNRNKPAPALKWSALMLDNLPHLITDTDRRRHNKLIIELESTGLKDTFKKLDISKPTKQKEGWFSTSQQSRWTLKEQRSIPKTEKPDTSFDTIYPTADGVLYFNTRGQTTQFPDANSAVQLRNQTGQMVIEFGFTHDIYRLTVSPIGHGFAALSSDCGLYVYNNSLTCIFFSDLCDIGTKKNYVRCVDVSPSVDRILYTIIDKAWCVDRQGRTCWTIKLPPKEGWQKIVERVNSFGTTNEVKEVTQALSLLDLGFPYCPDDIKTRYRELAKRWHPDKNPNEPLANERMQKLNSAFEILTGEKAKPNEFEQEKVYYKHVAYEEHIKFSEMGVAVNLEASMIGPGEDWIYAASLSGNGGGFLGSYSGRIIEVNAEGNPVRFFDIGCPPERVIEIHPFLYISTSTRLYIIKHGNLLRMLDIFDQGNLIFTQTGFGIIASKTLKWFSADGNLLGEIIAQNPIRRLYPTTDGLVVETLQHRALIEGVPSWWQTDLQ